MKSLFTLIALCVGCTAALSAEVSIHFAYKNAPLCNWEVTIKNGNAAIGKGTTDQDGWLRLSGVSLMSKDVNADGIKKTSNGEKKWSVSGYIKLDDENTAIFDFEPVVKEVAQESGMPISVFEGSWGLTLNDCSRGQATSTTTTTSKREEYTESPSAVTGIVSAEVSFSKDDQRKGIEDDIVRTSANLQKSTLSLQSAADDLDVDLYEAEIEEYELRLAWLQLELQMLNKELAGEAVPVGMLQERGIRKANYEDARNEHKKVEDQVKAARKAAKKEERANKPSGLQITKLKAQIKLKERAIKDEENSFAPSENKLITLRQELEKLQKELEELESGR